MKKILLIGAIVLVVGILTCAVALRMGMDLDMKKLEEKTYTLQEDFDHIFLDIHTTDILFALSEDGSCRVVCRQTQDQPHTVTVENGGLRIRQEDNRKWYQYIGINMQMPSMEVYLPKAAYDALTLEGHTGAILLSRELTFTDVKIENSTGKVEVRSQVENELSVRLSTGRILVSGVEAGRVDIESSTGDIRISDVNCKELAVKSNTGAQLLENVQVAGDIRLICTTGGIRFTRGSCQNLTTESSTGRQSMESVVASGAVQMESSTGDIRLTDFDGATIAITTDTGRVAGTVLTEKIYIIETDTGRVEVPYSTAGGTCHITTDTGDIHIQLAN